TGLDVLSAAGANMSRARVFGCVVLLAAVLAARPAFADATAFIGATTTPANRAVKGIAVGTGFLVIGFEFEYASTSEDLLAGALGVTTGSGNILLQTPVELFGFQPYVTTGIGVFHETLGETYGHTGVAPNAGAGVKVSLIGPLRLRVDYRVLKLGSGALYSP